MIFVCARFAAASAYAPFFPQVVPFTPEVPDHLVAAGIPSILNFAPSVVQVPEQVDLRQVDLATELQILGYHQHRRVGGGASIRAVG